MKSVEELASIRTEINRKVDVLWKEMGGNENLCPIYDGIVNEEKYINAAYKILWILKEPYDDYDEKGNVIGGDWCLADALNKSPQGFSKVKTWQQVIYVSHGILNGFPKFNNMDYYYEQSMYEVLRSIAFINLKKTPGHTSTPHHVLFEAYTKYKSILLEQVEKYEPEIIIGGNTLFYFYTDSKSDLGFEKLIEKKSPLIHYFNTKRLYIHTSHPSYPARGGDAAKEKYCDDIITCVQNWIETQRKI